MKRNRYVSKIGLVVLLSTVIGTLSLTAAETKAKAKVKETKTVVKEAVTSLESYKVDTASSHLTWVAKKVTGQHNGSVAIKEGVLKIASGMIASGSFSVDMTTIKVLDSESPKLEGHLKSEDFFSVDKNPSSQFEITSTQSLVPAKAGDANTQITGNLTIKGISKPLSFAAVVNVAENVVTAKASDIKVDRTQYDIKYRSTKFFGNLGDKIIEDIFLISIDLTAKK